MTIHTEKFSTRLVRLFPSLITVGALAASLAVAGCARLDWVANSSSAGFISDAGNRESPSDIQAAADSAAADAEARQEAYSAAYARGQR